MMRRFKSLRSSLLRATRRRRGRQNPLAPVGPLSSSSTPDLAARPWSVEELGATAIELGLYPEPPFERAADSA